MSAFFEILLLTLAGSWVRWSVAAACRLAARKTAGETVAVDAATGGGANTLASADPVFSFGFTLACYGAIALGLVEALPGALALERTYLAFAFLGVGGLVAEISSTGFAMLNESLRGGQDSRASYRTTSVLFPFALALLLSVCFAIVSFNQDLIDVVPPHALGANQPAQLAPIVVVATRSHDTRP